MELGGKNEAEVTGFYTIDPTKDPKTLDFISSDKTLRELGIYKLEKDKLTLCQNLRDNDSTRPEQFSSTPENGFRAAQTIKCAIIWVGRCSSRWVGWSGK